jgi:hypothetical protein
VIVNAPLIHRAPLAHQIMAMVDVAGALGHQLVFTAQAVVHTSALALQSTISSVLLVPVMAYQPDPKWR